jgi:homoserine O-acetyltransferase/O-succinyltransferase
MTSFPRLALRPVGFALLLSAPTLQAQAAGDYVIPSFRFTSGESLPALRIHYVTLGAPRRDAQGVVRNAVLVLHGTGGTGRAFLADHFAGVLFGPGQLLDTARYYVILPDGIGHGGSSKPSDGRHARFPHYTYDDMVQAQYLLLTRHLGVNHLRLIMGTSMGCMHAWIWGYTHAALADGLVPLACAPRQIAGRNRMMRTMIMDDIRDDPAWHDGDYTAPPEVGLRGALQVLYLMVSAPLVQQRQADTRAAADSVIRRFVAQRIETTDANDLLYAFDASRDYDPAPHLAEITTPVLAINTTDDEVNPPELGVVEPLIAQVPHAKFVLIPLGPNTHGHGTHSWPAVWESHLRQFLATLPER